MSSLNYPSLYNAGNTPLFAAYLESLHPRRAELFLFSAGDNRQELSEACVRDAIAHDQWIDREGMDVDDLMKVRWNAGTRKVAAYKMIEEFLKVSTKPADFPPFDLAGFIAGGGLPMRELWIGNQAEDGTYEPGIDSTAYTINNTGNPKLNPYDLANSFVWADKYGFRVAPGTKDSHRFQIKMNTARNWWFVLADPVQ